MYLNFHNLAKVGNIWLFFCKLLLKFHQIFKPLSFHRNVAKTFEFGAVQRLKSHAQKCANLLDLENGAKRIIIVT